MKVTVGDECVVLKSNRLKDLLLKFSDCRRKQISILHHLGNSRLAKGMKEGKVLFLAILTVFLSFAFAGATGRRTTGLIHLHITAAGIKSQ